MTGKSAPSLTAAAPLQDAEKSAAILACGPSPSKVLLKMYVLTSYNHRKNGSYTIFCEDLVPLSTFCVTIAALFKILLGSTSLSGALGRPAIVLIIISMDL